MKDTAHSGGIQVGVSTGCLFPLETERALELLLASGEKLFELFINSTSELDPSFRRQILGMLRASDGKIVSLHPFTSNLEDMLFSPYARRRADMQEFYKYIFDCAADVGASYVILHGPNRMYHMSKEFYIEQFDALDQIARRMGIQVLQENVERCISRELSLLDYMHKQLPDAGFALDLKQAHRCGINVEKFFQVLGESVKHIHFSDSSESHDCLWPGNGSMNIPDFISLLHQNAYTGTLIVEVYGCDSNMCDMLEAGLKKLRSIAEQKYEVG